MKPIKTLILIFTVVLFAACGNPKIVPATPIMNPVNAELSQADLHQMLVLLAKYKKYVILSDNGTTKMRIKYTRLSQKSNEMSSVTYDVVNDSKSYTMSYVDSENLGYNNGQISGSYSWYVKHFDGTLKKMYNDPEYLERMKVIVANPNVHH